ncbi:MAG: RNA polymerase sigma factor [Acidobacteria bacterium]|nr:MAG: RNA polymerase sigma factor [Acidobacteriota bacterium]
MAEKGRTTRLTDPELVTRSAAGDIEAFEQLYERHRRRVYTLCLRMLGNTADAEDLTQEVFIQVFRKLGTFRGASAFTTWLHRLTVNQVLMHLRKRYVRQEEVTEDGDLKNLSDPGAPRSLAVSLIDRITLEQAIAQLPPGYRAVLILHDVEGYEHEKIAEILGCSAGTSKSQLHKARKKLRHLLRARPTSVSCQVAA